jgi:hypothetical protein
MNTLTAARASQMIKWLSASHNMLCAIPAERIPLHLYSAWIYARAHSATMVDDLLRLSCADVAVTTLETV